METTHAQQHTKGSLCSGISKEDIRTIRYILTIKTPSGSVVANQKLLQDVSGWK